MDSEAVRNSMKNVRDFNQEYFDRKILRSHMGRISKNIMSDVALLLRQGNTSTEQSYQYQSLINVHRERLQAFLKIAKTWISVAIASNDKCQ